MARHNKARWFAKATSLFVVAFFVLGITGFGDDFGLNEDPKDSMSASGLLLEAGRLLQAGDYFSATPLMTDYLNRMESSDDRRVHALMQNVRFKLGKIMVFQGDYRTATTYLEQYLENKPVYRRLEALKTLAVSYFEIFDYENSISAVTNAFGLAPVVEEEAETQVKVEELREEDLGINPSAVEAFREEGEDVEDDLSTQLTSDKPPVEPPYTLREKVLLNMTLAESYSGLEEWEQSLIPYEFVINNAKKLSRRGYAIMKLVSSLTALNRFDRIQELILELAQTDAKYDIRVNMAMMNAATTLLNGEEYDSALMMYRMILSRRVLTDHYLKKINRLRKSVGLPQMQVTVATNESGRPWEALGAFDLMVERAEDSEQMAAAFCDALQVLVDPLEKYDRVEKRALSFLDTHTEGVAPRQVAYYLTAAYQKQKKYEEIKALRPYLEGFDFLTDPVVRQFECELHYMQAIADLMLMNYQEAQDGFAQVLEEYPASHQEDNLR